MGDTITPDRSITEFLPLAQRVFVVQAADNSFEKARFIGYYKDNKNKKDSGIVTFDNFHQPNGSRNF